MLPEKYRKRHGAKDLLSGAGGWFWARNLRLDQDGKLWIHPLAEPVSLRFPPQPSIRDPDLAPIVEFETIAGERGQPAFRIIIHEIHIGDYKWESKGMPTPDDARGLDWLPVLDVDEVVRPPRRGHAG